MSPNEIISDEEIIRVHANANFGSRMPRQVVNEGVLQRAFGYHTGSTMTAILVEHGLLGKVSRHREQRLTKKGFRYLHTIENEHRNSILEEAAVRLDREWPGPASGIVRSLKK